MRHVATRRTAMLALAWILVVMSACTAGSAETANGATGTAGTEQTTADPAEAPPINGATDTPGSGNSSTVPDDPGAADPAGTRPTTTSTTIATTTTPSTTTTTTLTPIEPPTYESIGWINFIREFSGYTSRGLGRWQWSVPDVEEVQITSTADGSEQPALWVPPSGDRKRPLLVILHSWSSNYLQHAGIPFAMWAQENGWAVIAPDFRGRNNDAESTGSDLAVQDVVDAIDWALAQDGVAPDRVYAVGYSGGGMMALLLAGRHPDAVSAVATWGPVYDLVAFYSQSRRAGRHYAGDLWRACGGVPTEEGPAQEECLRRSPMTYVDTIRDHGVPVFIGQGIYDSFLSPAQGANAFNSLADADDRLTEEQVDEIARRRRIPDDIEEPISTETFFEEGDPVPVFARQSASVWLVYFRSGHEMVYQAALRWFASDPR